MSSISYHVGSYSSTHRLEETSVSRVGSKRRLLTQSVALALWSSAWLPLAAVNANILFQEDFEGDWSKWAVKGSAAIVSDPLNSGRGHVVTFTQLVGTGSDLQSKPLNSPTGKWILSFDYLGLAKTGSIPDDFGGFIGVGTSSGSKHWAGTQASYYIDYHLQDTNQWTHVTYEFTDVPNLALVLEDFSGSKGVAGDAYFDNIIVADAPIINNNCLIEQHAIFNPQTATLTIPAVDIPLLDPITGEPVNNSLAVFQGEMKLLPGIEDFQFIPDSFSYVKMIKEHDPCHAEYAYADGVYDKGGWIHFPFVDVPSIMVIPPGLQVPGPVQVFDATLRQLAKDETVFHVADYKFLELKEPAVQK